MARGNGAEEEAPERSVNGAELFSPRSLNQAQRQRRRLACGSATDDILSSMTAYGDRHVQLHRRPGG